MDVWTMIDEERTAFADLCDGLTPRQWEVVSLCSRWRVRDVTAHVVDVATLSGPKFVGTLLRYGFRVNTMIEREAIMRGTRTPVEVLRAELRATVGLRRTLPGMRPTSALAGEIVHQQDVRRALHLDRTIDSARMAIALDEIRSMSATILPGKRRCAGLLLRATDMAWESGDATGTALEGTGEALLMAMAGRRAALDDLTGPGVPVMRSRSS